jgi:hypothetical protein
MYPRGWNSYYGGSFKYDFALDMCGMEQKIINLDDDNLRAALILDYADAVKESFDRCWPLTQYYKGTVFYGQVCTKRDWRYDKYTLDAMDYVKDLVNLACDLLSDKNAAAAIQYRYCNYYTVATKYPDSKYAKTVKGYCDCWIDHHAEAFLR